MVLPAAVVWVVLPVVAAGWAADPAVVSRAPAWGDFLLKIYSHNPAAVVVPDVAVVREQVSMVSDLLPIFFPRYSAIRARVSAVSVEGKARMWHVRAAMF